ncbi:MAG: type II secretion system protein [Sedimentisphaerales bacterium]|nr:type II secretion system protein [Sedimentisphaerales bacterium]
MCKHKAFTLIELLVVISIIALLVSILMPALNIARQQASGSVCLANQKSLILAWVMWAGDNNDNMVGGCSYLNPPPGTPKPWPDNAWAYEPLSEVVNNPNTNHRSTTNTLEDRINGIKSGALWPYQETHEVYHCPADTRMDRLNLGYRTYSVTGAMNGENNSEVFFWAGTYLKGYTKLTQIKNPSEKIVFVEEFGGGMINPQNNNFGSWVMLISGPGLDYKDIRFIDPLAIWHNQKSTVSFSDGHAQMYQCQDSRTQEFTEGKIDAGTASAGNPDVKFFARAYGGIPRR